jgi:hypothetical protein
VGASAGLGRLGLNKVCLRGAKQTLAVERRPPKMTHAAHSTLSNVRVAVMVCPVRENMIGGVVIVRLFPLISK